MKKAIIGVLAVSFVLAGPVAAANACEGNNVLVNGACLPMPDYSQPKQYADAGNGLVVELPIVNPDGTPYVHGVSPLPIVPVPRPATELGIDPATPLQTLGDETIVPLGTPMPSSYADRGLFPYGVDQFGVPLPPPLFNEDGTPYIEGVSPLPYVPVALPEYLPLPPRFTAADFKKLTAEQISNMQAGDFSQIPASVLTTITENQAMLLRGAQIATLTSADAVALNPEAVAAIVPSEFKAIQAKAFAAFKPAVIDELTVEQLDALSTKHFAAMKAAQVAKLDVDQVDGLDAGDIKALPATVVSKLKPALLAAMDDAQLEAFKSSQLKKLTKTQKKALTAEQLKVLAD